MLESALSRSSGSRARILFSRAVVLIGWVALCATSPVPRPSWTLMSAPTAVSFDVPPFSESVRSIVVRVEGHEDAVHLAPILRVDGQSGVLYAPDPSVDGSTGSAELPIVEADGNLLTAGAFDRLHEGKGSFVYYEHSVGCAMRTPCEREFIVRVRAGDTRVVRTLRFYGGTHGYDEVEPPPARASIEIREAP
jgi:hypothetical protein